MNTTLSSTINNNQNDNNKNHHLEEDIKSIKELIELWRTVKTFDKNVFEHLKLENVEPGRIEFSLIVPESLCTTSGLSSPVLSGGAIALLVDIVGSIAIVTRLEDKLHPGVSVEMNIHKMHCQAPVNTKITLTSFCYQLDHQTNIGFSDTLIKNDNGDLIVRASHTKFMGFRNSKM
eukprot:gene6269-7809_t